MDLKEIKELIKEFDESGVQKLSLEIEDMKLKLEKESTQPVVQQVAAPAMPPMAAPAAMPAPQAAAPAAPAAETPAAPVAEGVEVKAPTVGTFYAAGAPGAKPYVSVGQLVNTGDTVCIVEAMKMMNEIQSPVTGVVKAILVKDGEMVQFDQPIMIIAE